MPIAEKNSDFKLVRAEAESQSWSVEKTAKGHFLFKSPDGKTCITAGGDYRDSRAIKNLVARLRRAGLTTNRKGGR